MGTRSLTVFHEEDGTEIAVLYRQLDGYPEGHGLELAQFLADITLVNGIGLAETRRIANGMNCLAAQVVAHFKDGPGDFYLYPAGTRNAWEDYRYHIRGREGEQPQLTVVRAGWKEQPDEELFQGSAAEFVAWVKEKA